MDQIVLDRIQSPEGWALSPADHPVIAAKHRASRLSFAVLLLFYRAHGRFPRHGSEIEAEAMTAVARQIDTPIEPLDLLDMGDRTLKRHRAEIRGLPIAEIFSVEPMVDTVCRTVTEYRR
jgi:Domain of unknown function (DUF4158)